MLHARPGDPVWTVLYGTMYGPAELLQLSELDRLNALIWQLGGGRGPRPKALDRPGKFARKDDKTETVGTALPAEDVLALIGARNGRDL